LDQTNASKGYGRFSYFTPSEPGAGKRKKKDAPGAPAFKILSALENTPSVQKEGKKVPLNLRLKKKRGMSTDHKHFASAKGKKGETLKAFLWGKGGNEHHLHPFSRARSTMEKKEGKKDARAPHLLLGWSLGKKREREKRIGKTPPVCCLIALKEGKEGARVESTFEDYRGGA